MFECSAGQQDHEMTFSETRAAATGGPRRQLTPVRATPLRVMSEPLLGTRILSAKHPASAETQDAGAAI